MKENFEEIQSVEPAENAEGAGEQPAVAVSADAGAAKAVQTEKQSKFVGAFDKFFKFTERGSSFSKEIWSGVSAFLVSICIIFINVAIIGRTTVQPDVSLSDGTTFYTGLYLVTVLCAFLGTLLVGLICNLPITHSAGLSLASSFIAIAGGEGLTFANVLAVSFVSALVFTVICATPARKYILEAVPSAVRKALPVMLGVFLIVVFLRLAAGGDITLGGSVRDLFSTDFYSSPTLGTVCVIAIAVTVCLGVALKLLGKKHVFKISLLVGMVLYYLLGCIFCINSIFPDSGDRFFLVVDAYGGYGAGLAFENAMNYNILQVFKSGFDFTAYTAAGGNVALLFVGGILTFLIVGLYDGVGVIQASAAHGEYEASGRAFGNALLITGGINVVGCLLGSAPLSVSSAATAAASDDGGKTGLSSVICCIGYLISVFVWIVPMILATTLGKPVDYGHAEYGVYTQATFQIVYVAVALVGFSMILKGIGRLSFDKRRETLTAVSAILATALAANLTVGIAVGILADVLGKLLARKFKKISIPEVVAAVLMLLTLILGVLI